MLFKIIKKILPIVAKKEFQKIFETLYRFSLLGMNIGGGGDLKQSGEKSALNYIKNHLTPSEKLVVFDVGANVGQYSLLVKKVL